MSERLDMLVAVRVMNWRTHNRNTAWWVDAAHESGLIPEGGIRGLTCGHTRWSPSTSISAAWEVVDKLHGHHECAGYGHCVQLHKDPCGDRSFLDWKCRFMGWANPSGTAGGPEATQWFRADTAPLAICLAALRACNVSESEISEALTP